MNFEELINLGISNDNIEAITKLINRISYLIPNDKDKLIHLHEIMSYIQSMINGDSLAQFATYTYSTDYAKKALDELKDYVQEKTRRTKRNRR